MISLSGYGHVKRPPPPPHTHTHLTPHPPTQLERVARVVAVAGFLEHCLNDLYARRHVIVNKMFRERR